MFILLVFWVTPPLWVYSGAPWFSVERRVPAASPVPPGVCQRQGRGTRVSEMERWEHTNPSFLPLRSYRESPRLF